MRARCDQISFDSISACTRDNADTIMYFFLHLSFLIHLCFFLVLILFHCASSFEKQMLSVIERVVRTNCVVYDARPYSNVVCNACESQSRNDFYLILLTNMRDENDNFVNLKSKCIDMHDAVNLSFYDY